LERGDCICCQSAPLFLPQTTPRLWSPLDATKRAFPPVPPSTTVSSFPVSNLPIILLAITVVVGLGRAATPAPTKVLIVAGQSNVLNWHAAASTLPADAIDATLSFYHLSGAPPDRGFAMPVNATSGGIWIHLGPQVQEPFVRYERHFFGPEITLARTLAREPDSERIAVIKVGFFGTNLAEDWRPGARAGNRLYERLLREVSHALALLDQEGRAPCLAGFFWMQGETDANRLEHAEAYAANLASFVVSLRRDLKAPTLPFVLGRIGPPPPRGYPYQNPVREAQVSLAANFEDVAWVDTDDLPRDTDGIHLLAPGVMELGIRWAHAWLHLVRSPAESSHAGSPQRGN